MYFIFTICLTPLARVKGVGRQQQLQVKCSAVDITLCLFPSVEPFISHSTTRLNDCSGITIFFAIYFHQCSHRTGLALSESSHGHAIE